jgi:multidrug efflux system outer membrane protein
MRSTSLGRFMSSTIAAAARRGSHLHNRKQGFTFAHQILNDAKHARRTLRAMKRRLQLLWVVVLLAACSTMAPQYRRPDAPVASHYGAATGEAHAGDIPWRDFIRDPQLRRILELALDGNRDLRVAVLNVEKTRSQYHVARSSLAPTVSAGAAYTASHASAVTSTGWQAGVGVSSYELDLFGRVRSLTTQALEQYLATEEAQRAAQVSLVAQVAKEYFAWRQAQEAQQVAEQTLASVTESLRVTRASFEAGAVNELSFRSAEGEVQSARASVSAAKRQSAEAKDALELLLGQPIPADLPASMAFGEGGTLAPISAGMPSELLEQRPDILEAEHTLKAANAKIGAARAAFFPRIALTASAGAASSDLSSLFRSGAWSFSPSISIPIFDGGSNRANLDVAQTQKKIEIANYEKAIQTAFREVKDALAGAETYARQVEDTEALVAAESRRLELANARYLAGEDTYLEVLSAQKDLYSARQDLLSARAGELDSRVALYQALGGGWK